MCARIVLDVAEKNAGARQLFERRGMEIEAISPSILLVPNTRAYRMDKPLWPSPSFSVHMQRSTREPIRDIVGGC